MFLKSFLPVAAESTGFTTSLFACIVFSFFPLNDFPPTFDLCRLQPSPSPADPHSAQRSAAALVPLNKSENNNKQQ